ncbi:MAG: hypothetical protein V1899_00930 [Planctomycetota bacterium]
MTNRVIDLAETPARLNVRYENLVIVREGQPEVMLPLVDLAVPIMWCRLPACPK